MIGLDQQDYKIIDFLARIPTHPSKLSQELRINRTTLNYRLKRLELLGMIKHLKWGRKTIYRPHFYSPKSKRYLQVYEGQEVIKGYRELLDLPKNSIILSVQGSGAVQGELKNLPPDFIMEAHRVFKKKKIILKGFANEKALSVFDKVKHSLVQSHVGRSLSVKLFNNNLFSSDGEIMSTSSLFIMANPSKKKIILIKDKEITRVLYDVMTLLFNLLEGTSTFDLNSHLKRTYNQS